MNLYSILAIPISISLNSQCYILAYIKPMAVDQELSDSDSSLDSASEELQDPHLDSLDLAQSTSMTISHTSVEIHSFSDSPADSASVSLHSSSTVGVPPTLSLLEDDTE